MSKVDDPVIALFLEYEAAVLSVLEALHSAHPEARRFALLRFAEAVAAGEAHADGWDKRRQFLRDRGIIPDEAWKAVAEAMEKRASEHSGLVFSVPIGSTERRS